ncbi:hypothetical protein OpiT1DRAFT_05450 [Opitutaceae bacterium TAV1]|nr:hypothetical protein OpiT1DRAFT_05445 [Opitutaceae bacterium TAV1]EIQ00893.1 hypothetical protein OpiT1DRAFT_05450 [Opitutaceae bacterium TAV1]
MSLTSLLDELLAEPFHAVSVHLRLANLRDEVAKVEKENASLVAELADVARQLEQLASRVHAKTRRSEPEGRAQREAMILPSGRVAESDLISIYDVAARLKLSIHTVRDRVRKKGDPLRVARSRVGKQRPMQFRLSKIEELERELADPAYSPRRRR